MFLELYSLQFCTPNTAVSYWPGYQEVGCEETERSSYCPQGELLLVALLANQDLLQWYSRPAQSYVSLTIFIISINKTWTANQGWGVRGRV